MRAIIARQIDLPLLFWARCCRRPGAVLHPGHPSAIPNMTTGPFGVAHLGYSPGAPYISKYCIAPPPPIGWMALPLGGCTGVDIFRQYDDECRTPVAHFTFFSYQCPVVMSGERFDSFAKWLPDWVALVRTLAERQNAFLREALEVLAGAGDSSPGPLLCFEILIDKKEGQWRPASHRAPLLGVHKKIPISLLSVLNFPRFQVPPQSFSHHFHSAGLRDGPLRWWFSEGQLLLAEVSSTPSPASSSRSTRRRWPRCWTSRTAA